MLSLQTITSQAQLAYLVLCGISNETLSICECDIARCCPVALVVGVNLDFSMLEDPDTRVGCPQIDANCRRFCHLAHSSLD